MSDANTTMQIRSLACKTDLIFSRYDGEVIDRGDYLVVKTPDNPAYFFGNFILFSQAPKATDYIQWSKLFEAEFRDNPLVRHKTFIWDSVGDDFGEIRQFLDQGYSFEESTVLTASVVKRPEKYWDGLEIRPIQTTDDWTTVVENQIQWKQEHFEKVRYRNFKTKQFERYRKMTEAGLGFWFGAFAGKQIVADLGVYFDGNVGRFQSVETHPSFRRRGACGTLVHQASQFVFDQCGIERLVMVADPDYHAAGIYESVGFQPTEKQYAVYWFDRSEWQN